MEKLILIEIILGIWGLSRINASWWWYVVLIGVSVLSYIVMDNAKESNKDEKGQDK